MSWDLETVANALADAIGSRVTARTFAIPPTTLNPPAVVVNYPDTVAFGTVALGIDEATIPVSVVVGLTAPPSDLSDLADEVRRAIGGDRTLAGAVKNARPTELRAVRVAMVAGIDVLTAEVVVVVDS